MRRSTQLLAFVAIIFAFAIAACSTAQDGASSQGAGGANSKAMLTGMM
jgi:hypothetical protein